MTATMPPRNQCTCCSPQPYGAMVDGAYLSHSFPNIVHWQAQTQGKWEENLSIESILATCPIATNGRWINTLFQLLAKGLCLPIIQKQQTSNQTTKPTHCFIFILFVCHQLQWGLAAYNNWDGPSFLLLFSTPCFGWTCGTSWVTFGHPNHESYHDHDYHQFLYMKISNHVVDSSAKNRSRMFAFTNNSIFLNCLSKKQPHHY